MTQSPRTLSPSENVRLFWGLVVQPLVTSAMAFVSFPLLLDRDGRTLAGGFSADRIDAAVSVAAGVGIVAFFVTLVGVLPTVLWLVTRRYVTFARALVFGVGFGNLPVALGTALTGGVHGPAGALRAIAFASLVGMAGAAAFWVISIRGRDFSRDVVAG